MVERRVQQERGRDGQPGTCWNARGRRATETALTLRDGLSLDDWKQIGARLCAVDKATGWWIGDWLNYGQRAYGERYREATEITRLDYQTLRNYAWVAGRFPVSRRRDKLSFQHHAEVAGLEPHEQDEWLSHAVDARWSRNELRRRLRSTRTTSLGVSQQHQKRGGVVSVVLNVPPPQHARWLAAAFTSGESLEQWMLRSLDASCNSLEDAARTLSNSM